ncbi:unnamed protein product [Cyprideis torosa]|uniref:Uncharacterized protein n=1 Tax=Cyprideis torosa TaxID=163714 RepID=A0A7R8ZKV1_9CRUS|nr:unnamed protein product [Cyprideis torosa]CAG0882360.1 unnamed protein product [Cyprideis torosa]
MAGETLEIYKIVECVFLRNLRKDVVGPLRSSVCGVSGAELRFVFGYDTTPPVKVVGLPGIMGISMTRRKAKVDFLFLPDERQEEEPPQYNMAATTRQGVENGAVAKKCWRPRHLFIQKGPSGYGFTLRHFIVYPPDSLVAAVTLLTKTRGQHGGVHPIGAFRNARPHSLALASAEDRLEPMDTIFVKFVQRGGPAEKAGLNVVHLTSAARERGSRRVYRDNGGTRLCLATSLSLSLWYILQRVVENVPTGIISSRSILCYILTVLGGCLDPCGPRGWAPHEPECHNLREDRAVPLPEVDLSKVTLTGTLPGSDRLIEVNERSLEGKSYAQVVQIIQNSKDSLTLLVIPEEDDIIQKVQLWASSPLYVMEADVRGWGKRECDTGADGRLPWPLEEVFDASSPRLAAVFAIHRHHDFFFSGLFGGVEGDASQLSLITDHVELQGYFAETAHNPWTNIRPHQLASMMPNPASESPQERLPSPDSHVSSRSIPFVQPAPYRPIGETGPPRPSRPSSWGQELRPGLAPLSLPPSASTPPSEIPLSAVENIINDPPPPERRIQASNTHAPPTLLTSFPFSREPPSSIMNRMRQNIQRQEDFLFRSSEPAVVVTSTRQVWPPAKSSSSTPSLLSSALKPLSLPPAVEPRPNSANSERAPSRFLSGDHARRVAQFRPGSGSSFDTALSAQSTDPLKGSSLMAFHSSDESIPMIDSALPLAPSDERVFTDSSTDREEDGGAQSPLSRYLSRMSRHPALQLVSRRAKQFESGSLENETSNKVNFYRSELARLSLKLPSGVGVPAKKQEYEAKSAELLEKAGRYTPPVFLSSAERNAAAPGGTAGPQPAPRRGRGRLEDVLPSGHGNRINPIGSTKVHCEPPSEWTPGSRRDDHARPRSSSLDSHGSIASSISEDATGVLPHTRRSSSSHIPSTTAAVSPNRQPSYLQAIKTPLGGNGGYMRRPNSRGSSGTSLSSTSRSSTPQSPKPSLAIVTLGKPHTQPPRRLTPPSSLPLTKRTQFAMPPLEEKKRKNSHHGSTFSSLTRAVSLGPSDRLASPTGGHPSPLVLARKEPHPIILRRNKTLKLDSERVIRQASYLKATHGPESIEPPSSPPGEGPPSFPPSAALEEATAEDAKAATERIPPTPSLPLRKQSRAFPHPSTLDFVPRGHIKRLRQFFEDRAGHSLIRHHSKRESVISQGPLATEHHLYPVTREGPVHAKYVLIEGRRAPDRSWKTYYAILRAYLLFLVREKQGRTETLASNPSSSSLPSVTASTAAVSANGIQPSSSAPPTHTLNTSLDPALLSTVVMTSGDESFLDLRGGSVTVAEDYTKRKNVLRITSRAESQILLQFESVEELKGWLRDVAEAAAALREDNEESDSRSPSSPTAARSFEDAEGAKQLASFRQRSPSGHSPLSKTKKETRHQSLSSTTVAHHVVTTSVDLPSPKTKTWRGRMARQLKKSFHHAHHHQSSSQTSTSASFLSSMAIAAEGGSIGVPLEMCPMNSENIPCLVAHCASTVEELGMATVGVYRVPGNKAAINALTDAVNRGWEHLDWEDPRWKDVNVISSLMKSFFRCLPDSLIPCDMYRRFIDTIKIDDHAHRLIELKKLVQEIPDANFDTLRFLCYHLAKVTSNYEVNKMDPKNLAIVFGPNLVRPPHDDMKAMVTDTSDQCKVVEHFILYVSWFFADPDDVSPCNVPPESVRPPPPQAMSLPVAPPSTLPFPQPSPSPSTKDLKILESSVNSQALLLENVAKVEGLMEPRPASPHLSVGRQPMGPPDPPTSEAHAVLSSVLSAASLKRTASKERLNATKTTEATDGSGGNGGGTVPPKLYQLLREAALYDRPSPATIEREQKEGGTIWSYANLSQVTEERIRKFEQETKAMLAREPVSLVMAGREQVETALSGPAGGGSDPEKAAGEDRAPPLRGKVSQRVQELNKAPDSFSNEESDSAQKARTVVTTVIRGPTFDATSMVGEGRTGPEVKALAKDDARRILSTNLRNRLLSILPPPPPSFLPLPPSPRFQEEPKSSSSYVPLFLHFPAASSSSHFSNPGSTKTEEEPTSEDQPNRTSSNKRYQDPSLHKRRLEPSKTLPATLPGVMVDPPPMVTSLPALLPPANSTKIRTSHFVKTLLKEGYKRKSKLKRRHTVGGTMDFDRIRRLFNFTSNNPPPNNPPAAANVNPPSVVPGTVRHSQSYSNGFAAVLDRASKRKSYPNSEKTLQLRAMESHV